jgi:membrane-bound lytic murein transglycosylase B
LREAFPISRSLLFILLVSAVQAFLFLSPLHADGAGTFQEWVTALEREALSSGISRATLDSALKHLAPIPRVIELDRRQPEFTLTLEEYLGRMVTDSRVAAGREKLLEHRELLEAVSQRYGVSPELLVALWGVESSFGSLTGGFPVIGALATLAFDGRRSSYFRKELLLALSIVDQGHIAPDKMTGSWAGAMGYFQFMPSSFKSYAVDYDGDGRKDIWNSVGDAFASAANYLSKSGWMRDQTWGREVRFPQPFNANLIGTQNRMPVAEWQGLGVRTLNGQNLPEPRTSSASVVQPDGSQGRAFLVYDNYRALLNWNRSHLFAISVGTLVDRMSAH